MLKLPEKRKIKSMGNQKGQALLLILLVMAVSLTIVLSIVSRSITEVSISGIEEDALRAFSAAEAGIEEALLTQTSTGVVSIDSQVKYEANVDNSPDVDDAFKYPVPIVSGQTATFWFTSHNNLGQISCAGGLPCFDRNQFRVCWGDPAQPANQEPALEVLLFYDASPGQDAVNSGDYSDVEVMRYAVDENAVARGNGFDPTGISAGCTIDGFAFEFSKQINWSGPGSYPSCYNQEGCILVAKIRSYYNSVAQPIGITVPGPATIPAQGNNITSLGTAGESNRKVNVYQGYPETPAVFDAAIFSMEDLLK